MGWKPKKEVAVGPWGANELGRVGDELGRGGKEVEERAEAER